MKKMTMMKKRGQEKLRRETEVLLCIRLPIDTVFESGNYILLVHGNRKKN